MNKRRTLDHNTGFTSNGLTCKIDHSNPVLVDILYSKTLSKRKPENANHNHMKGLQIGLFLTIATLFLYGCDNKITFEQAKAKVHSQNEKLHQVVATKNLDLLKEVYAEDAYFLAPGLKPVRGRDSIIVLWADGLEDVLEMHSESIEIGGTVDILYEVGIVENKIRSHNPDTVYVSRAKYNNVWKRDKAGDYRLTVDIWNKIQ